MSDYIVRATAADGQIRAFAAVTTDMDRDSETGTIIPARWQQRHWDVF